MYSIVEYGFVKGVCSVPLVCTRLLTPVIKARTWQVAVSLVFQCMLVLSANIFLADRLVDQLVHCLVSDPPPLISSIHAMIRCRIQSAVIITLSICAFAFGVATILLIAFGQIT
jgi:hypothetical protein